MDSEAERIFGISLDSVIGKPIQNLLPNIQTETNKVKKQFLCEDAYNRYILKMLTRYKEKRKSFL